MNTPTPQCTSSQGQQLLQQAQGAWSHIDLDWSFPLHPIKSSSPQHRASCHCPGAPHILRGWPDASYNTTTFFCLSFPLIDALNTLLQLLLNFVKTTHEISSGPFPLQQQQTRDWKAAWRRRKKGKPDHAIAFLKKGKERAGDK